MTELLNIDCMEYMKTVSDKYFDLAIVDPPYGINMHNSIGAGTVGYRIEKNGTKSLIKRQAKSNKNWDSKPPVKEYFEQLFRISKNQIIWGANHFIDLMPLRSSCWIVWDKKNGGTNQSDCELAWTSFDGAVRKFSYLWSGMIQEQQNKLLVEKRIHPTQKPRALYKWIFENYSKIGDKILDTHLGSMSSAIVAEKLGYDFVGCEIDKEYFDTGKARFNKETDLGLFNIRTNDEQRTDVWQWQK